MSSTTTRAEHPDHEHAVDRPDDTHGHEMHGHAGHGRAADGDGAHGREVDGHEHDRHAHAGHGDHVAMFRDRFWVSLTLTAAILYFSEMIQDWFGYAAVDVPGADWIPAILGTVLFVHGGRVFLQGGVAEARRRAPGMMSLISLAITVAFVASWLTELGAVDELDFWWELAALITVMLLGHWQEMRAIGHARGALAALAELLPDDAERVTADGDLETVPASMLAAGDVVLVRPGARVPADGHIVEGAGEFDESMLTGESRPVSHGTGDRVVAGSVALATAVRIEVDAIGEETALAGIQRLVAEAQASSSRTQRLADRAAAWLFAVATASAVLTAVAWLLAGQPDDAVARTITVLVIACPHALGLAIPLVVSISTAKSARAGVLVKDRLTLERVRTVDAVLFDKTGTLTAGAHEVTDVAALGMSSERLLGLARAAEVDSEHPLARAIVRRADAVGAPHLEATGFDSMTGRGVEAQVDGHEVAVGGPALLRERQLDSPPDLGDGIAAWEQRGAAVLYVVVDGDIAGALALEDQIRPESRSAVEGLHAQDIEVVMITGDSRAVADHVAAQLGIDRVYAEVLPEDKDRVVRELQEGGLSVAMVGDGVNDAPALARADAGIAIGAGTDVAIESAGIVLASDDPRGILSVLRLSRASWRKMLQNLAWATGYNLFAIPIAAGVLAPVGIVLAPAVGAALMSLSTIVVALNAQLLRRLDLGVTAG